MSSKKISQLIKATSVAANDLIPIVQNGVNKSAEVSLINPFNADQTSAVIDANKPSSNNVFITSDDLNIVSGEITAINNKIGQPDGIASLDENGTLPLAELPFTNGIIEGLKNSDNPDATNPFATLQDIISKIPQSNIIYVSKVGDDLNNGKTLNEAVYSMGRALELAMASSPSAINQIVISCMDASENGGIFLKPYIHLNAPMLTLYSGNEIGSSSVMIVKEIINGLVCLIGDGINPSYVYADKIKEGIFVGANLGDRYFIITEIINDLIAEIKSGSTAYFDSLKMIGNIILDGITAFVDVTNVAELNVTYTYLNGATSSQVIDRKVTRNQRLALDAANNALSVTNPVYDTTTANIALSLKADKAEILSPINVNNPEAGQILGWNGSDWVNVSKDAQIGDGINFYLDNTVIISANSQNANIIKTLTKKAVTSNEVTESITLNNSTGYICSFLYEKPLGGSKIDGNVWEENLWRQVNKSGYSEILANYIRVIKQTASLTITGEGTSRTATASGEMPFVALDANANITMSSYIQTPSGLFQIIDYISPTSVTIKTLTTYTNETSVVFSKWAYLFKISTGNIEDRFLNIQWIPQVEGDYPIASDDTLAIMFFGTTINTEDTTIYFTHNGNAHASWINSPLIMRHNDTAGIQGGADGDYQHLTTQQITSTQDHISSTSNPHSVTKSQVGLGNVQNLDQANPANITQDATHRFTTDTEKTSWNGKQDNLGFTPENIANKETSALDGSTTKYPCNKVVSDALSLKEPANANIQAHISNTSNPHSVTKSQVGLGNVQNLDQANPANITQDATHRFTTDTEKTSWNGKQDNLGFTPENIANKETSALDGSTTKYPCNKVVSDALSGIYIKPYRTPLDVPPASPNAMDDEFTAASLAAKWTKTTTTSGTYTLFTQNKCLIATQPYGNNVTSILWQTLPSGSWAFTTAVKILGGQQNYMWAGLMIRNSSNGHMVTNQLQNMVDGMQVQDSNWSSLTAYVGTYLTWTKVAGCTDWIYIRITYSGGNLLMSASYDGVYFYQYDSQPLTNYVSGANQIGLICGSSAGADVGNTVAYFNWFRRTA